MAATHLAMPAKDLAGAAMRLTAAAAEMSEDLFRQTGAATELWLAANALTALARGLSGDSNGVMGGLEAVE